MSALIRPIGHFAGTRDHAVPTDRLRAIRKAAARFNEEMLSAAPVRYYRSFDLIRVPYPTRYALRDACRVPHPFIHLMNRVFIIQFDSPEGVKTLLVGPSDVAANRETPFFRELTRAFGKVGRMLGLEKILAPHYRNVEDCLRETGIAPERVDYITYDHLHTQDIRRWLGTRGKPGYFPNAKLLVMRQEWTATQGLTAPQSYWYCPKGTEGVPEDRVILLDGDSRLGESVALVRTPGHTLGNHSIVVRTPDGVYVTSENGVSTDSYAPLSSRIPGVRAYARRTGMEVILNGNTLEGGLDQYLSMVQEKEMAGKSPRNPDFPNVVPSSELTPYWLFPGIRPSFRFGELSYGSPFVAAGGSA